MRLLLLERWRVWRSRRHLQRALVAQAARIQAVESRTDALSARLSHVRSVFEESVKDIAESVARANVDAQAASTTHADLERKVDVYERSIDALRSELKIAKEMTIPSLIASNELALQRINADISVQMKKQMEGK